MLDLTLASRARCVVVWLLTTATTTLTVAWAAPDLCAMPGARTFPELVVAVAALALATCVGWLWVVVGVVVAQALSGRSPGRTHGVPRRLRLGVLLVCGVAAVGSTGAAHAEDGGRADPSEVLAGLPPPERVLGAVLPAPDRPDGAVGTYVVRRGDTLWDIAAADLDGEPDDAAVDAHWRMIHGLNAAVIGADPDLIRPGQRLRMQDPSPHR